MKCVADIPYDASGTLALDVYLPETLMAPACVIYVHGGGFRGGSKADPEVIHVAQMFTDAGFALAAVDLRSNVQADTLGEADAQAVSGAVARSAKVGLKLSEDLYGVGYQGAIEDVSQAIDYIKSEAVTLGIGSLRIGVLGHVSGGIAALGLGFAPRHMMDRVTIPAAIACIGGALVQPWRVASDSPPSLLFANPDDALIPIEDVRFGQSRADLVDANFRTIEVDCGANPDLLKSVLEGEDASGVRYRDLLLAHFEPLMA